VWFLVILIITMFFSGLYFTYRFFTKNQVAPTVTEQKAILPISNHSRETLQPLAPQTTPKPSSTWRIAGELKQNGKAFTILMSNQGAIRLEPSSQFRFSGLMKQGELDGEIITRYSGSGGTGQ